MFGSSGSPPPPELAIEEPARSSADASRPANLSTSPANNNISSSPTNTRSQMSGNGNTSDSGDKRTRRSSGVSRARDMLSSAKSAFGGGGNSGGGSPSRNSSTKEQPSAIQRLGKTDPALSVPQGTLNNAAGESHPGPRSTFRVGVAEDKNKKCRRTMEDTHAYLYIFLSTPAPAVEMSRQQSPPSSGNVVETDNGYFAIFDGHAGTFAAEWCGKKLHLLLEDTIRRNPNKPIPELLDETFTNVDQQLEKLPLKNSGCTAVIAVLRWEDRIPNQNSATGSTSIAPATAAAVSRERSNSVGGQQMPAETQIEARLRENASRQRVLYTANVGDARIVLCRNGKALRLSYDHKGSDDNEGKRIANAGGLILNNRVNGVLAVTRALGDAYMKDLVTGHPYTTETVIQPDIDEFMILACDGVSPHIT
jgi:protein phosphatase PTC1